MLAMVASVSAVLANSFAGQLLSGEGITTDFSIETSEAPPGNEMAEKIETARTDEVAADKKPARQTVTFAVDLHCGNCEDRVVTTFDELDGVSAVDADAGEQLRGQIADLGFHTDVVETAPPVVD